MLDVWDATETLMDMNKTVVSRTGRPKALWCERIQDRTVPALNLPAEYLICTMHSKLWGHLQILQYYELVKVVIIPCLQTPQRQLEPSYIVTISPLSS